MEKDEQGRIVNVKSDPYEFLIQEADSIQKLTQIGARQQTKKKTAAKTRTVTKPAKTPKEPETNPGLEAFDEEAARW